MAWSAMSDPLTMDTLINCAVLVKEKQLVNNNQPDCVNNILSALLVRLSSKSTLGAVIVIDP